MRGSQHESRRSLATGESGTPIEKDHREDAPSKRDVSQEEVGARSFLYEERKGLAIQVVPLDPRE